MIREKISKLIEKLQVHGFTQVHKSYIINTQYILKNTSSTVTLQNETVIPIGRKYRASIK